MATEYIICTLTLILTCISTIVSIFTMFCMIFVYKTLRDWRPFVDKVYTIFQTSRF